MLENNSALGCIDIVRGSKDERTALVDIELLLAYSKAIYSCRLEFARNRLWLLDLPQHSLISFLSGGLL